MSSVYDSGTDRSIVSFSREAQQAYSKFKPNVTYQQMFDLGIYSGSYFRPITSAITGQSYSRRYLRYGLKSGPKVNRSGPVFSDPNNRYGVHSGSTLREWEEKAWITHHDPYGWIEWYCNFSMGRRIPEEDTRQIKRWYSVVRRFSSGYYDDTVGRWVFPRELSPKIKQLLLNWAVYYG